MLTVLQLSDTIMATLWAMLRVSGLVLVAPILGAVFVPARVRVLIAAVLAVAMLPVIAEQPAYSPLSGQGMLTIAQEIIISIGMGLSFATVVDPQQSGTPLLGRLYIIIATLLLLAANAHLALIAILAESFAFIPLGSGGLNAPEARQVVDFASVMFVGAMQLAMPAVIAILMVNVAFGVISRAAPTLNLFAVGFPITLMTGFLIMMMSVKNQGQVWDAQLSEAFVAIGRLIGGP
jgi:flagellar biosynthetic protein FliR